MPTPVLFFLLLFSIGLGAVVPSCSNSVTTALKQVDLEMTIGFGVRKGSIEESTLIRVILVNISKVTEWKHCQH